MIAVDGRVVRFFIIYSPSEDSLHNCTAATRTASLTVRKTERYIISKKSPATLLVYCKRDVGVRFLFLLSSRNLFKLLLLSCKEVSGVSEGGVGRAIVGGDSKS